MAVQKKVDLNTPLDASARPQLSKTTLTPELTQASAILHGDLYRQLQSKLNRHIFWHPYSKAFLFISLTTAVVYRLWDYITISDSIGEFFGFFLRSNDFKFQIVAVFPVLVAVVGSLALLCYLISDDLRIVSDKLLDPSYVDQLYGFDIKEFARIKPEDQENGLPKENVQLLSHGLNSQIMVYRDSPIAILTLNPDYAASTPERFVVRISGCHVRKVFAKIDFDSLLVDWAILRSRQIYQDYVNSRKIKKVDGNQIRILANSYTFDPEFSKLLTFKNFAKIESTYELNPFDKVGSNKVQSLIHKVFDIQREVYALNVITRNEDKDILLSAARDSAFVASAEKPQEKKQENTVRRRKH